MARRRRHLALLTSLVGILILAAATNAFLRPKKTDTTNANTGSTQSDQATAVGGGTGNPVADSISSNAAVPSTNTKATPTPTANPTSSPNTANVASPPASGSAVTLPNGPTVTVPSLWVYSFSTENNTSILNFGTQQFGPDHPYDGSMKTDASGYFSLSTVAPSEAAGPQTDAQTIKTSSGSEADIKTYTASLDSGDMLQVVASLTWNSQSYTGIFYTDAENANQVTNFTNLIASIQ